MKRLFLAGMCTVAIAGAQTLHRLDSLSPAAATAGRGALTLTLTGRFLANNETVSMTCPIIGPAAGCPPIVRLFNSTSQVVVSVPAAYFAYANLTQPISATVASFSDSSPLVVTRTFTVNPPLVINGPTILPQATEGVPYQFQFGPSSGGTAPVSWSCTSSFTPPPGMTLGPANGTCLLSGTPTQTGTYSLQVSASDSGGGTAIKGVRLTVVPSPVSITTTTVPNGTAGAPYSAHIAATGGTGTHTWTIIGGSLPPGLQLASSTGPSVTLTGTPTASGSYGFVVGVSTPVGTASRAYDMAVSPPPLSIAPPSLPSGQAGVPYAAAITATGGSGTYSWSIVQGSPPPGLQLSPTVGSPINLNGIPSAAGTYDFVLQVTAGRVGVTRDYSITVTPPLVITTLTLPDGTVGSPFSAGITSTGGSGAHSWSIVQGSLPPGLQLSPSTGPSVNLTGVPSATGPYSFVVSVASGRAVTTQSYTVTVTPALTITTLQVPDGVVGSPYNATIDSAGGSGIHSWSISSGSLPPGVQLNPSTGSVVSLTGTPDIAGTYSFVVRVAAGQQAATRPYSVTVSPALSITTPLVPDGIVGSPYNATIESAGGSGIHSWSISSGSLPPGVQLNPSTGSVVSLTGTPDIAGTYSFVVRVAAGQQVATRAYSVTVTPALSITTVLAPDGIVGSPYNATIASAGGSGAHSWSISDGSLPPGVQLNPSTGSVVNLTGTPDTAGTYRFVVRVAASQQVATRAYSVTVASALSITTVLVPDGVVGSPYNATIASAGGSGAHSWSISDGSLPPGVQLNPSTGSVVNLTGTPDTAGTYRFVVRVAASQQVATRAYSVTVASALSITTVLVPDGVVGSPYNATIASAGGSGAHSWSISDGSLPPGVQLNPSTGSVVSLTGTPDTAGTYRFVVRVAASQQVATRAYSVTVTSALSITTVLVPDGVVGSPYNATIASAGGSGAHSWSISEGSLPPGVQLNPSTGSVVSLTGTPDTAGTYRFVVRVAASQQVATRAYSVTVTSALSITTVLVPDGVVGSPYNATIASAGGSGTHSWSISEGSLPPGLQLGASAGPTVNLTGTPSLAGPYSFVVRVASGQQAATRSYSISVTTTLSITRPVLPDGVVGSPYNAAINSAGGSGLHSWSLASGALPPGVQLAPSTGPSVALAGTPTASGSFSFRLQVNSAGATAARDLSITVTGTQLTIGPQTLPDAVRGTPYIASVTAEGGTGPYLWAIQAGSLPPGIALAGTGLSVALSGTPTTAGPFVFQIRVTGANGESAVRELSIRVNAPLPPQMTIAPPSLPSGTVNSVYAAALAVTGGTAPYAWSLTAGVLPPGIALGSTGSAAQLTGTPSAAGNFVFTIRVNDSTNQTATHEYSVTVSSGTLRILTTALPNGARQSFYASTRIDVSGGLTPYLFAVTSGLLPAGLTLDGTSGTVSGTPLATGTSTFAVTVTDSRGTSDSRIFSIVVTETITTLPPAMVGSDYAQRITPSTGSAPFQCSLTAGRVPPGLALSTECDLRGRPTDPGSGSMTIEIRDRFGRPQAATYLMNIVAALSLRPDTLESAVAGRDYSATLQAAGGFPPLALSVEGLPAGLSFSPQTGVLSGRVQAGSYPFRATVTDSASNRLVRDYTLVASAGLTLTSTSPLPDGELDRDYLFTLTAAGGISPYTFVAEGSLPAGLTLEPAGRLLGRPSSPGGLSFSVRVSDAAGATARGVFAFFVPMPAGTQETPYSLRLLPPSGNFGAGCQLVSGALPAGVQLNSGACSLSNAPSAAGSFEFAVRFGGAQTADIRQAGVIQPALRLRPGSLSAGIVSVPYSVQFAGDGALRPYSFRVTAGELPSGLALDLTTGVLSGTPSAAGTFRFSVTLTDSNARFPASVTTAYSLSLTPPVLSSVRINGLADAVDPLGQPRLSVEIGDPYALPITGRLQLTFTSNADNPSDDPFVSFSNGSRSMAFSVLADRTAATFAIPVPAVQAGTTAGDIRIAASLETGGVTITPNPAPERIIHIARAAPQISQLEVTRTAGRLTIRMTGFATPRSVRSARFRFTAGAGVTLQTSEFSLPVIDLFNGWYQNRQSTQFGSQFTFTQVFDVQGDAAQIRTVEVTLSNTEGESRSVRREI